MPAGQINGSSNLPAQVEKTWSILKNGNPLPELLIEIRETTSIAAEHFAMLEPTTNSNLPIAICIENNLNFGERDIAS